MIRLEELSYRYKDNEFQTIEGVNLSIKRGEFVVISGRSGSGKSTLFRCINGLCPLFFDGEKSGNIYLSGKNIAPFRICDISISLHGFLHYRTDRVFRFSISQKKISCAAL